MTGTARLMVVIPFCCAALAACDGGHKEKVQEPAVQEHVWQGQVKALDKAKEVEGVVMDSAEQQRQMVEQQTATPPQ